MKIAVVLVIVLAAVPAVSEDHRSLGSGSDTTVIDAPSFVPDGENYIHIGGGFFSTFDLRTASVTQPEHSAQGSLRFRLRNLGWRSRYVYLPEGVCTVRLPDQSEIELDMEQLDYVKDPESGRALYRLVATGEEARVVLVGDSPNPTATRPSLDGLLYVWTGSDHLVAEFHMTGRSETEAERHLNQVVFVRSDSL
jgi:hypothetical protein